MFKEFSSWKRNCSLRSYYLNSTRISSPLLKRGWILQFNLVKFSLSHHIQLSHVLTEAQANEGGRLSLPITMRVLNVTILHQATNLFSLLCCIALLRKRY